MGAIKRFLANRNVVTLLGVLIGVGVLYFGYTWRVRQAVDPIDVPFARQEIAGNTLITESMIGTTRVNRSLLGTATDLITLRQSVINMYSRFDTTIVQGSLFFRAMLMHPHEVPDAMTRDISPGHTIYSLNITEVEASLILPNDHIDLFFTARNDNGLVLFGRFIRDIRVIAVKDRNGQNVTATTGQAAFLNFAVSHEHFTLLRMVDYIRANDIKIIPVPRNQEHIEDTILPEMTSNEVRDFILARAREVSQITNPGDGT
jgi:hypothetical protein